jgi:superfamily II DNA/RNA helicase
LSNLRADISAVLRNARPASESTVAEQSGPEMPDAGGADPDSAGPNNSGVSMRLGAIGPEAESTPGPGQRRRQNNQQQHQHPGSPAGTPAATVPAATATATAPAPAAPAATEAPAGERAPRRPRQAKDSRPERLRLVPDAAPTAASTGGAREAGGSVWQTATETPDSAATFASLGVPDFLVAALADEGITTPFPIQAATLPDAMAGRDILGRAKTGSGKTLGFSLPLVARLASGVTRPGRPRGLVLVPTRELATQVQEVLEPLAQSMGLRVTTIFGGVSYRPQIAAMTRRTDIVVACPGRLADIIGQGYCDLGDVEITVLDEADHMADLGFLPTVRRLLDDTPSDGQRLLFSATLDGAVDVLAKTYMTKPVLHSVDEASSPASLEHHVFTVAFEDRVSVVADLASGDNRSLVFTRTKHGAEKLAKKLTESGIPAVDLHGNLSQAARARNLGKFSAGHVRVLVATDVASRGIHVDGIDLVIHADPPAEHKAYVHRSGRTARGGAAGTVVTVQTRSQSRDVSRMMREIGVRPHMASAEPGAQVLREIAGPIAPPPVVPEPVADDRPRGRRPGGQPRSGGQSRPGGQSRLGGQSGEPRRPQRSWQQDGAGYDGRPAHQGQAGQSGRPARSGEQAGQRPGGRTGRPAHFGSEAVRADGKRRDAGRTGGAAKAS